MSQSFATEIAKERFYDQMERYRNLNDGLDLPAAVIPLYLAGLLFFGDRLVAFWHWPWHFSGRSVAYVVLLVLTVASAVCVIWAVIDYCRTVWCYQDGTDLPSPQDFDEWLKAIEKYAIATNAQAEDVADVPLRDYYVTAAESTFEQNENRSRNLFYCRRRLVVSLVLITLAMAAYYFIDQLSKIEARTNAQRTESATAPSTSPGSRSR